MLDRLFRLNTRQRYINKKTDGKTIGLLVVPPQGLDCVTFSYAIVYSILTFPLNPPLVKGDFARVLAPQRGTKKKEDLPIFLFSTL